MKEVKGGKLIDTPVDLYPKSSAPSKGSQDSGAVVNTPLTSGNANAGRKVQGSCDRKGPSAPPSTF